MEYRGGGLRDFPSVAPKKLNLSEPFDPSKLRLPLAWRFPTPVPAPSSVDGWSTRKLGLSGMLVIGDDTSLEFRLEVSLSRDEPDSVE